MKIDEFTRELEEIIEKTFNCKTKTNSEFCYGEFSVTNFLGIKPLRITVGEFISVSVKFYVGRDGNLYSRYIDIPFIGEEIKEKDEDLTPEEVLRVIERNIRNPRVKAIYENIV